MRIYNNGFNFPRVTYEHVCAAISLMFASALFRGPTRWALRTVGPSRNSPSPSLLLAQAVLAALSKKKFSFETPTLLPALATGESYHRLKSGAEACLFTKIPGVAPKMTCANGIGRACAEVRPSTSDHTHMRVHLLGSLSVVPIPCPHSAPFSPPFAFAAGAGHAGRRDRAEEPQPLVP